MQYDITLRSLVNDGAPALIRQIAHAEVAEVLPTDFPDTKDQRVDCLVRLTDKRLLHLEWQAQFDADMPLRMLQYWLPIRRRYRGDRIEQVVVQVGAGQPIAGRLKDGGISIEYRVIDSRDLEPALLLASPNISDVILSILCGRDNLQAQVRGILTRIGALTGRQRRDALRQLLILARLQRTVAEIKEAIKAMPITIEIDNLDDDPFVGRYIQQAKTAAKQQGLAEGEASGEARGEARALLRLLDKRFGPVAQDRRDQIMAADLADLERWFDRAIDAALIQDVFAE